MVIWIRNGIMVIENFCGDRYLWDPTVTAFGAAQTAIKLMVISISPLKWLKELGDIKQKPESVRRKLATTSNLQSTQSNKRTDGPGLFKNRESEENHSFAWDTGEAQHLCMDKGPAKSPVQGKDEARSRSCFGFLSESNLESVQASAMPCVRKLQPIRWITWCSRTYSTNVYWLPTMCQLLKIWIRQGSFPHRDFPIACEIETYMAPP